MKAGRILLIIVFTVSISSARSLTYYPQDDCKKIEVEVVVENTTNGNSNGRATINLVKGDTKSAKYIFCEAKGKVLNQKQLENKSLDGLKKGSYLCIVTTSDCTKKISFTID